MGDMRPGLCASRLGIVAPHPPLRGTFSPWEKDAPRELGQSQTMCIPQPQARRGGVAHPRGPRLYAPPLGGRRHRQAHRRDKRIDGMIEIKATRLGTTDT